MRSTVEIISDNMMNKPTYRGKLSKICNAIVERAAKDWMNGYFLILREFGREEPLDFAFNYWDKKVSSLRGVNDKQTLKSRLIRERGIIKNMLDSDNFIGSDWYYALTDVDGDKLRGMMKDFCRDQYELGHTKLQFAKEEEDERC